MLVVLTCAALPRLWAACADQGVLWPDEIYQGPEQAHRLVFGYGFIPWEFQQGVRSWIYPGLLSLLFRGLSALGVDDGLTLMTAAKCLMGLWAVVGIAFAMRLAGRLAGLAGSLSAGVLLAMFPPSLAYDARCTTEAASGPLLIAAAALALEPDDGGSGRGMVRAPWAAGAAASMATALRPQNGVVLIGIAVVVLAAKRWKDGLRYALAAAAVLLSAGLLDAITLGAPFHSLVGYVRVNLIEDRASQFGPEPFTFYWDVAWTSVGPAILAIAAGLIVAGPRAPGSVLIVLAFLVFHSLVPHKELRFLLPVVPLSLSLSGAGIARALSKVVARVDKAGVPPTHMIVRYVAAFSVILSAAMAYRASDLTLADLGWNAVGAEAPELHLPAWRFMDASDRLLARAGREGDLCGLALTGLNPIWTGGYSYLHRDVPFFPISPRALADGALGGANYVIARNDYQIAKKVISHGTDITLVASEGDTNLYRRDGACGPPPPYYTRTFK